MLENSNADLVSIDYVEEEIIKMYTLCQANISKTQEINIQLLSTIKSDILIHQKSILQLDTLSKHISIRLTKLEDIYNKISPKLGVCECEINTINNKVVKLILENKHNRDHVNILLSRNN